MHKWLYEDLLQGYKYYVTGIHLLLLQYAISQLRIVHSGLHLVTYLDVGNFCDKSTETILNEFRVQVFLRFSISSQSVSLIYELAWLDVIGKSEVSLLKTSCKVVPLTTVEGVDRGVGLSPLPPPYLPPPAPHLPPPFWSGARFARAKFSSLPFFLPSPSSCPLFSLLPPPLLPPPTPSSPSSSSPPSRPLFSPLPLTLSAPSQLSTYFWWRNDNRKQLASARERWCNVSWDIPYCYKRRIEWKIKRLIRRRKIAIYIAYKGSITIRRTAIPGMLVNFSTFAFLLNFSFMK